MQKRSGDEKKGSGKVASKALMWLKHVKTIINLSQIHHFNKWVGFQPSKMVCFISVLTTLCHDKM
jgi:hypothetical protein